MSASPRSLLPQHHQLIVASAISTEVCAERGYRSEETRAGVKHLGFGDRQCNVPALLVPLFNVRGAAAGYQTRPDNPRQDRDGKPVKYESPKSQKSIIDVHPGATQQRTGEHLGEDGTPVLVPPLIADPAFPLFITEGVRKGDCLFSLGFCCAALLGVWNFRGKNSVGGYTALADWEDVALKNRDVYITFDSDVMNKNGPAKALARLKMFLESRGARAHIIYLPSADGAKVGVDDWIFARHTQGWGDEQIRNQLFVLATDELKPASAMPLNGKPIIALQGGNGSEETDRTLKILADNHERALIYERPESGKFVKITTVKSNPANATIIRPIGGTILTTVTRSMFEDAFTRYVAFQKYNRTQDELVPVNCPEWLARWALDRAGQRHLPELLGTINAPIMRPDGTILYKNGYDEQTGLFLSSSEQWVEVSERPSDAEIKAAVETLKTPIADFPFTDETADGEVARSVIIAAMFTAIQRRLLLSAPLIAIDAPKQSSGKSLLCRLIAWIATGHIACICSLANIRNQDEISKKLMSILLKGDPIVNLDNLVKPLENPSLSTILTEEVFSDRKLGTNDYPPVRTNVLWIATGNNLVFPSDTASRAIKSRIDARMERPETRSHWKIPDLRTWVLQHRPQLAHAILTILRGHFVVGRPTKGLEPLGRYEDWSEQIRNAVVWAGFADPVVSRDTITAADPDMDKLGRLLTVWHHNQAIRDQKMTVKRLIEAAGQDVELMEVLHDIAAPYGGRAETPDKTRLGNWLRDKRDNIYQDLILTRAGQDGNTHSSLWQLGHIAKGANTCGGSPNPPWGNVNESEDQQNTKDTLYKAGNPSQDSAPFANPLNGSAPKDDVEVF